MSVDALMLFVVLVVLLVNVIISVGMVFTAQHPDWPLLGYALVNVLGLAAWIVV